MNPTPLIQQKFPFMADLEPPAAEPVDWSNEVQSMADQAQGWLPTSAVARYFGVSPQTIHNWATKGTRTKDGRRVILRRNRVGRTSNVHVDDLRAFETARQSA